jgi:endonuclease III
MKSSFPIDPLFLKLKPYVNTLQTPVVELIEMQTKDPFKVLITTILSARTKDQTTKEVAQRLFTKINKPSDLQKYSQEELEKIIYPIGFYKNKAKQLKQLPLVLKNEFNNKLPQTIEELIKLPGVGRKTANLVLAVAFKIPAICVDTHVHRITNRWGYIKTKTPVETEMKLREILPKKYWLDINWMLVSFGQAHCTPRKPRCQSCPIKTYCEKVGI